MQEIERKFLVKNDDYKLEASHFHHIIQGYLSRVPERTVRIRIIDGRAFLTIKGKSSADGTTRLEWEQEIDTDEARNLLEIAEPGIIEKVRYIIPLENGLFFEVDEFLGDKEGLVLAEIELPNPDTPFQKPEWLDKEVTGDSRYYNSQM